VWRLDRLYRDPDAGSDLARRNPGTAPFTARYDELLAPHGGVAALRLLDRGEAIIAADAEMNIRYGCAVPGGDWLCLNPMPGRALRGCAPRRVLYSLAWWRRAPGSRSVPPVT